MKEKIKAFIKKQDLVTIASGVAVVIIILYLGLYTYTFCRQYISDDGKDWNDFSSALGGFVGTVINGLVAILVYNTYKLQKEEVRKLSESAQEQSDYAAEQNFQGMFRLMMEILDKNRNELCLIYKYESNENNQLQYDEILEKLYRFYIQIEDRIKDEISRYCKTNTKATQTQEFIIKLIKEEKLIEYHLINYQYNFERKVEEKINDTETQKIINNIFTNVTDYAFLKIEEKLFKSTSYVKYIKSTTLVRNQVKSTKNTTYENILITSMSSHDYFLWAKFYAVL